MSDALEASASDGPFLLDSADEDFGHDGSDGDGGGSFSGDSDGFNPAAGCGTCGHPGGTCMNPGPTCGLAIAMAQRAKPAVAPPEIDYDNPQGSIPNAWQEATAEAVSRGHVPIAEGRSQYDGCWVTWGRDNDSHKVISSVYSEEIDALRAALSDDTLGGATWLEWGEELD